MHSIKVVSFLASIFVTFTFSSFKIWLPQIMANLCWKPKLLTSLHALLTKCSIIAHTNRHKRRLEKVWMINAELAKWLIRNENIFNLAVIDNIDFKEIIFQFENIYDITHGNFHATLRMVFQSTLPASFS